MGTSKKIILDKYIFSLLILFYLQISDYFLNYFILNVALYI